MKCKDCGAHLPYGAYGHIRCEFCNIPNYVPLPGEKDEVAEMVGGRKKTVKEEIKTPVEEKGGVNPTGKMQKCINCGTENGIDDLFCSACGIRLKITIGTETRSTQDSSLQSFTHTWQTIVFRPKDFYKDMHNEGEFFSSHIFMLWCASITAVFYWMIIAKFTGGFFGLLGSWTGVIFGAFTTIFLVSLIFFAVSSIVGGKGSFSDTFKVMEYTFAPAVFFGIPVINIIASFYQAYLGWIGVKEVHRLSSRKTWLVILSGVVVYMIIMVFVLGFFSNFQ